MDVEIRRARSEDAGAIASVHIASWRSAYRGLVSPAGLMVEPAALSSRWRERIESLPNVLVAEADGAVVGFSGAGEGGDAGVAVLHTLYLVPEWWGKGVGRALLERMLDDLREAGWREVFLWVLEGNGRACRFYEAAGFRPDGGREIWRPRTEGLVQVRYRRSLA